MDESLPLRDTNPTLFLELQMEAAAKAVQLQFGAQARATVFSRVTSIVSQYLFAVGSHDMIILLAGSNERPQQSTALENLNYCLEKYIIDHNMPYIARFEPKDHDDSWKLTYYDFVLVKIGSLDRTEELVDVLRI